MAEEKVERELDRRQEVLSQENSLIEFVESSWSSISPADYQPNWAIDALCDHLQAVAEGQIKRLLINFPPRCGKTTVASICYPAWTWARRKKTYLSGPQVRFLCGSYNDDLALQNSNMHRRLVNSPWFQERWGKRFTLTADQNTKSQFDTTVGGSRISTSARGSLLGIGGDVILIDDPHNTKQAESEAERMHALSWWKEISTTRLNDPKRAAIIVIMQRLHEEDVSGLILESEWSPDWVHLCIPMEYDWPRHCVTSLGWEDPRGLAEDDSPLIEIAPDGERLPASAEARTILDEERQGELMWPERFGPEEMIRIKANLGPYMSSGRLQQQPTPDKGGIFKREWWQVWEPEDGKFPVFELLVASLDSAFTEKEENDPSALTVWGVFELEGKRRIMLVHAWRKHLAFSGPRIDKGPQETLAAHKRRTQDSWGLMEWLNETCNRFRVDRLLIEAKANGISAAQELQNRFGLQDWAVQLCPVKGDKVARALAVQPTWSQMMIYAPNRDWAEMTIDEMAVFPKGKHDHLTDSATQAMKYFRTVGLAQTDEEVGAAIAESLTHRARPRALYPC